jgi:acyl-CoA thioesterase
MKNNELTEPQKQRAFEAAKTIPFVNLIGMELVELKGSAAIFKLEMREQLRQPHGLLHGGATASLIDTAMAFAVITCLTKDEKASTVDLTVHYLRPVTNGTITCAAKVVKAGKRLLTVSAEVVSDQGKLVATALSTYSKV